MPKLFLNIKNFTVAFFILMTAVNTYAYDSSLFNSDYYIDAKQMIPEETSTESTASLTNNELIFSQDVILRGGLSSSLGKMGRSCNIKSFSVWGNGYFGGGDISPNEINYSLDNDIEGAAIGINAKFGGNFTFSAYYNFNEGKINNNYWESTQKTNLAGLGLFYNSGNIYYTLMGTGGTDSYNYKKSSKNDPLSFDGYQFNGYFEIGGQMSTGGLFTLKPFTSLLYNYLVHDELDKNNYFVNTEEKEKFNSFDYLAGARIDISPGSGSFTFQLRGAWVHQMGSDSDSLNTFFLSRIPGTITPAQYFFEGSHGSDFFWGGIGMQTSLFKLLSVTLDYDILTNKKQTSQFGSLGLLIHF